MEGTVRRDDGIWAEATGPKSRKVGVWLTPEMALNQHYPLDEPCVVAAGHVNKVQRFETGGVARLSSYSLFLMTCAVVRTSTLSYLLYFFSYPTQTHLTLQSDSIHPHNTQPRHVIAHTSQKTTDSLKTTTQQYN